MTIEKIIENRLLQNALFWLFFAIIPFSINLGSFGSLANMYTDIQYYLECAFLGYFNNLLLMPRLFDKRKYVLYLVSAILLIIFITWVSMHITSILSPNYPQSFLGSLYEGIDYGIFLIAFGSGHLVRSYIYQSRKISELEEDKLSAEVSFLRSQINPHLLFNTLNTIYSYSVTNAQETPKMILKLSDIMRYMLYETDESRVSLEKELNYLKDYVALQKIRLGKRGDVTFEVVGNAENLTIAPMILISFIENAFKYSMDTMTSAISIKTLFVIDNKVLKMTVINNYQDEIQPNAKGGIGHKNVLKRLELLYPDQHQLVIEKEETVYKVHLELTLVA